MCFWNATFGAIVGNLKGAFFVVTFAKKRALVIGVTCLEDRN